MATGTGWRPPPGGRGSFRVAAARNRCRALASAAKPLTLVADCQLYGSRRRFSEVLGARRGAERPAVPSPRVVVLRNPDDRSRAQLLRDPDELLVNLSALGLEDRTDEASRELIADIGALLVHAVQENPAIGDDELDDIAAHALQLFSEMSVEDRAQMRRAG